MQNKEFQLFISAALAALSAYFEVLVVPLIMLTVAMIIDYGTGMATAWKRSELSSKKGVSGIIKKVGYIVLVCVGMIVDWLIFCGLENFDAGESYKFSFGMLVAIWLIINELISILENLGTIGVPVPNFLIKVIKRLKITAEKTAETAEKENGKYRGRWKVFTNESPVRTKSYFDVISSDTVFNTGDLITGVFRYTFG